MSGGGKGWRVGPGVAPSRGEGEGGLKVLQKHGLLFTEIFPGYYKTYNFCKLVFPAKFHIKHWKESLRKKRFERASPTLSKLSITDLFIFSLKEHLSKGISVSTMFHKAKNRNFAISQARTS